MKILRNKKDTSLIFANILDHFDTNLYAFIGPIIAPLFFPKHDHIVALILTYSILATSSIIRPLGVLIFGTLAKKIHPWKLLCYTLTGVGLSTFTIGLLPTFASIGYYSAALMLLVRIITGIFAQGEKLIASIYIIENKSQDKAILSNAWMESAVILGCALASFSAQFVNCETWRIPFLAGGILAIYALYIRRKYPIDEQMQITRKEEEEKFKISWLAIMIGILSGSIYYMTYELSFVFINSFAPLVTDISYSKMLSWNTKLLLLDIGLLIPIGNIIKNRNLYKIQQFALLGLALPAIPFFHFMQNASHAYIIFVRCSIVFFGIIFSCVMNLQFIKLFNQNSRYLLIGVTSAIGTALIGRTTSVICLFGWHKTKISAIPGIYLFVITSSLFLLNVYQNRNKIID